MNKDFIIYAHLGMYVVIMSLLCLIYDTIRRCTAYDRICQSSKTVHVDVNTTHSYYDILR